MQGSSSFPCILLLVLHISSISGQIFQSPVGSGCFTSEQCVPNSDCVQNQCKCKTGFTLLASLECKMDFGGTCSQNQDCNTAMGLRCVNSVCQCQTQGEEYLFELGSCMNSSMKGMFQQVAGLINQTEFELMRFATLFNIYMIQSTSPSGNEVDGVISASDINPVVYQRLEQLEQQLVAAQSPIPSIVANPGSLTPPTPTSAGVTPITPGTAQIESPQATTPPTFSLQNFLDSQIPSNVRRQAEGPPPGVTVSITRPIVPPTSDSVVPPPPAPGPSPFAPFANLGIGQNDGNGNGLTQIIPNFIRMFTQFLPFLQQFNNVLSTAILSPFQNLRNQNTQTPAGPTGPSNILGGLIGRFFPQPPANSGNGGTQVGVNVNPVPGVGVNLNVNPDRIRGSLLSLPLRLLQIPGRIFNSFFGPNSALVQLRQTLLPNVDFNVRAFQILPWPLG